MSKTVWIALLAACSAGAQAFLTIDHFADSVPRVIGLTPTSPGTWTFDHTGANAVGGHRRVQVDVTSLVAASPQAGLSGFIGGGRSVWALDDGVVADVTYQYGALAPLNLDLSWSLGLQFGFDFVDQPLNLAVTVWNESSPFTAHTVVQPTHVRHEFLMATGSFAGADWTNIDRVDVRLSGPASFDMVQAPLTAHPIPEPFTMGLGAAALALALRKRKRLSR